MNPGFLQEPSLEFAAGRHVDVRFGIMFYGPLDSLDHQEPSVIRLGLIGSAQSTEALRDWLERCRRGIPAKSSKQPNLFPGFPGFREDSPFRKTIAVDSGFERTLLARDLQRVVNSADNAVREAVDLFVSELQTLIENRPVDVVMCAPPKELLDIVYKTAQPRDPDGLQLDFHHLLKARAMRLRKPIQIILPTTYGVNWKPPKPSQTEDGAARRVQDEATRAWNILTALYYKAGGIPWRLIRSPSDLTTCYVGISFYETLDKTRLFTSVAQIFNERGDGIIVRGGQARRSKDDRQVHLEERSAANLLADALVRYRQEHRTGPARIVIHKTSSYDPAEEQGFLNAAATHHIDSTEMIHVTGSGVRLFRVGAYPPLRGTTLSVDERHHLLYTRGSVPFFATYAGMYIPRPLILSLHKTEQTPRFLMNEVLALTKMNWNNTQFDGSDPITVQAARQVGAILKYVGDNEEVAPRYSFYM